MAQEQPHADVDAQAEDVAGTGMDDLDDLLAQGFEYVLAGNSAESSVEGEDDVPTLDLDGEDDLDDSDEGDSDEDDAADGDAPDAAEDEPKDTEKPQRKREVTQDDLVRFGTLVAQNPANITQVPRRAQGDVIKSVLAAAYQRGTMDAAREWQTRATVEEQLRVFVSEREKEEHENPEAFLQWARSNPQEAKRYYEARDTFATRANPPATPDEPTPEDIQRMTQAELGPRLDALPDEFRQKVAARIKAGDFPATSEGFRSLRAAVDAAYLEMATAAREPVRRRAKAREEGMETRKNLARPIVSNGQAGADQNKIRDITDLDELLTMQALGGSR